jgi:predicted DNA-binding protein with PD1-like motif
MRSIEHPGPVHAERIQCVAAGLRAAEVELPPGGSLLKGLTSAVSGLGATSAVLSLRGGSLAPMAFVMPATSSSPKHAVYYSDRYKANGAAHLESGCVTFGQHDGQPWLHCHAVWTESDGRRRCGHILPADSQVDEPVRLSAWLLKGADFVAAADDETNFTLFQPARKLSGDGDGGRGTALVVRVRPNTDICTALEDICAANGIRHGRIRGGVGSLVGAAFDDGRTVEPFVTEVFIREGSIAPRADGSPRAVVDISLVDHTGQMAEGRLKHGHNPVLVTFEAVIERTDETSPA